MDNQTGKNKIEYKNKTQKVILLVDDDPLIVRMYQNKFSNEGYRVYTAFNGEEALIQVKKEKPDIILLDMMMPKMNGVETVKMLKNDPDTEMIPIIILTNLGDDPGYIEEAKKLGIVDYLVKSEVDLKSLSERVKKVIETGE